MSPTPESAATAAHGSPFRSGREEVWSLERVATGLLVCTDTARWADGVRVLEAAPDVLRRRLVPTLRRELLACRGDVGHALVTAVARATWDDRSPLIDVEPAAMRRRVVPVLRIALGPPGLDHHHGVQAGAITTATGEGR